MADNIGDNKYNHSVFEDGRIKLKHLQMNGEHVFVDLRKCTGFLTAKADPFVLREDPIIMQVWPQLQKVAEAINVVDIYDPATWGSDD